MDFLLWIALAGVIVFLLGLFYSKLIDKSAKQPAADRIQPAKSPVTKADKVKPAESKTPPAPSSVKMVVPQQSTPATETQPAATKAKTPAAKTIPAAEPVGPAHSKPAEIVQAIVTEAPVTIQSAEPVIEEIEPEPAETLPATEPERLTKPRHDQADDLTQINGIGKAIQEKLFTAGIFHYDQLSDLNEHQIKWLNHATGFAGRAERENWSAQAKKLASKAAATEVPKRAVKKPAKTAGKTTAAKAKPKTVKKAEKTA